MKRNRYLIYTFIGFIVIVAIIGQYVTYKSEHFKGGGGSKSSSKSSSANTTMTNARSASEAQSIANTKTTHGLQLIKDGHKCISHDKCESNRCIKKKGDKFKTCQPAK